MTDDETDAAVLHVLDGQSPDYLIAPEASAFVAAGLDPDTVGASLARLAKTGHAEEQEVVLLEGVPLDPFARPILDSKGKDTGKLETVTPGGFKTDEHGEPLLREKLDDNGKPVTIDDGWAITDKGRKHNSPAREAAEQAAAAAFPSSKGQDQ